ncbi:MAG: hypothetical protein IT577_01810 [Verrucomicrobiae bacterium]|nr:hypothetical protein [Verrucomicrobiae bacterium]
MTNPFSLGFVAVFREALDQERLTGFVRAWLERYEGLEQVMERDVATMRIGSPDEVRWDKHLQFRILNGDEFAWVYVSRESRIIETTGMPSPDDASLSLTLLVDLPGLQEIVTDQDEKRLEQLEAEGVIS